MAEKSQTIPMPIQMALEALKILEAAGGAAEGLAKSLPAYAMQLSKAEKEVTVDILLAHVREGLEPAQAKQKPLVYAEVVAEMKSAAEALTKQLMEAVTKGETDTVRQLLEKGADVNACDEKGLDAFLKAAKLGHTDIVKLFLEKGTEIYSKQSKINNALLWASSENRAAVVELLLENGADANYKDTQGDALYYAARSGHALVARILLDHGVDVNGKDKSGMTPLIYAAWHGSEECVRLFLDKNADINAKSDEGHNALMLGTIGSPEVVRLLLDAGADVNETKTKGGGTALMMAAGGNKIEAIILLLERGAKLDIKNDEGMTALMRAALGEQTEAVALLIDKGGVIDELTSAQQETYHAYKKGLEIWQMQTRQLPLPGLAEQNPAYFKGGFTAVRDMLLLEHMAERSANQMAFAAIALFGTEQRVLQYLVKWGKAGQHGMPLSDALRSLKAPLGSGADTKAWGDAALKCGPGMAGLFRYADRLPRPEKSSDGKTWSYQHTREKAAKEAFAGGDQCPELAALCFEHTLEQKIFDAALKLIKKQKKNIVKKIPEIVIDGKAFGMEGATFHRLAANDVRGLFLGEITNCCQSIGGVGTECATYGFMSENSGFYVVEKDNKIIGETWAWRSEKGELVFDSLETLGGRVSPEQWKKISQKFAKALIRDATDITALHIGIGGGTPKTQLTAAFKAAATPAQPINYSAYRDSKEQVVVWKRRAVKASLKNDG
jgi:ankyrin repeat protein